MKNETAYRNRILFLYDVCEDLTFEKDGELFSYAVALLSHYRRNPPDGVDIISTDKLKSLYEKAREL